MKTFTGRLPMLVKSILALCDVFVMSDDLVNVPIQGVKRTTMRQMLKDQARRQEQLDKSRPFKRRTWPQFNLVMTPLVAYEQSKQVVTPSSTRMKGSQKHSTSNEAPDKTIQQSSLDTSLSRNIIIERARCYENYETDLGERIAEFERELDSRREQFKQQSVNWRSSVLALKPDWIFEIV